MALLLVAACVAMIFAGCQEEKNEEPTEPAAQVEYMTVAENNATSFKIVSFLNDTQPVKNFAKEMLIKTGAKFETVTEAEAGEHAIYIGTTEQMNYAGADLDTKLVYTTFEITVKDGNVYVAVARESVVQKALEKLKEAIVRIEDKVFGIDMNISGVCNVAQTSAPVPEFQTKSGTQLDPYESGSGNYTIVYQGLKLTESDQEVAKYEQALLDAGYSLYQTNKIDQNRFFTYVNGDSMIHCNYFKTMREFRIVYGPKTYLGSAEPITEYERVVTPSISIVGATDSVLCMVYQAPDGSFVIIDGGYGTDRIYTWTMNQGTADEMTYVINRDISQDMANLWALLESKTPQGQKPQVTWMMSHGDPDHICLPPLFMKEYQDRFDLNLVVYNFPIIENVGLQNGEPTTYQGYIDTFIAATKNYFPNASHMVVHTGQKLYLPGTEIEFLFTHEDYWPNKMRWMNDTCTVWRITAEGKTIMVMGDATTNINNQMVGVFGTYLKSDILQLNHHGSNGGSLSLYKLIAPSVAIWACEDNRFLYDHQRLGTKSGFEFNKYIRETVKDHYSGSSTHTILLPSLKEEK